MVAVRAPHDIRHQVNKPLAFVCVCIAGLGLVVLSRSVYCTVVYGHGDFEAGNFHRCVYSAERDPTTGAIRRDWDTRWDLVSSTEGAALAQVLDMWVVGFGLVVLGAGIYAAEQSSRGLGGRRYPDRFRQADTPGLLRAPPGGVGVEVDGGRSARRCDGS